MKQARIADQAIWQEGAVSWFLAVLEVQKDRYFLPLAMAWEDEEEQDQAADKHKQAEAIRDRD